MKEDRCPFRRQLRLLENGAATDQGEPLKKGAGCELDILITHHHSTLGKKKELKENGAVRGRDPITLPQLRGGKMS